MFAFQSPKLPIWLYLVAIDNTMIEVAAQNDQEAIGLAEKQFNKKFNVLYMVSIKLDNNFMSRGG